MMQPVAPQWLQDWCRRSGFAARREGEGQPHAREAGASQEGFGLGPKPAWLDDRPEGPDVAGNVHKASLPPWNPQEERRLYSALAYIPADIDGRTWASFGRALHELNWVCDGMRVPADRHAPDGTDIGLEIWNDWSKTSTGKGRGNGEYHGRADLEKRWRHFDETAGDYRAASITIGSIYHKARQRGWTDDCAPPPMSGSAKGHNCEKLNAAVNSQPSEKLKIFRGDELLSTAAASRSWFVERFVPAKEVTMLGGDGGAGKTTLALQLSIAGIAGGDWVDLKVTPCNVLYISAEDPKDEIHFRLEQITRHLKVTQDELARFKVVDLAGKDATIAIFEKGLIKPTPLFHEIESAAREQGAGCIVFDAVADFFGGNENERREVAGHRGDAVNEPGAAINIVVTTNASFSRRSTTVSPSLPGAFRLSGGPRKIHQCRGPGETIDW